MKNSKKFNEEVSKITQTEKETETKEIRELVQRMYQDQIKVSNEKNK